jgi:hypothetical protein
MSRHVCIPVHHLLKSFRVSVCLSVHKTPRNAEWIFMKVDSGTFNYYSGTYSILVGRWESSVGMETGLWAVSFGVWSQQWWQIFMCSKMPRLALGPTQLPNNGSWVFFPWEWRGQTVKLTTRLHLVPWLRMSGAIPLLTVWVHGMDTDNCMSMFHFPQ